MVATDSNVPRISSALCFPPDLLRQRFAGNALREERCVQMRCKLQPLFPHNGHSSFCFRGSKSA